MAAIATTRLTCFHCHFEVHDLNTPSLHCGAYKHVECNAVICRRLALIALNQGRPQSQKIPIPSGHHIVNNQVIETNLENLPFIADVIETKDKIACICGRFLTPNNVIPLVPVNLLVYSTACIVM